MTLWCHYGTIMLPLWFHYGSIMVLRYPAFYDGFIMVSLWFHYGFIMASAGEPCTVVEDGQIAARMTYLSAPEALQSAVAAGLLNVASKFIGTMENAAKILGEIDADPEGNDAACRRIVQQHREQGQHMPGFGHHLHRPDDPRTPKLFAIAMAHDDINKKPIEMIQRLGSTVDQIYDRHLTINATGATAAVLMGAGIPVGIMRGFAVISRAAGLVAHVMEEQVSPTGRHIWAVSYTHLTLPTKA